MSTAPLLAGHELSAVRTAIGKYGRGLAGRRAAAPGRREHGGWVKALLGSGGQHCVQHAHCPALITRDGGDTDG